mgnify:FL=1
MKMLLLCIYILAGTTLVIYLLIHPNVFSVLYPEVFRLDKEQVSSTLHESMMKNKAPICSEIQDCDLIPGDILLRRYVTERTKLFDRIIHPYFTHTAFYLGDDRLAEAVGSEKNSEDDIQINTLSRGDWMDEQIEGFVIIRPTYTADQLDSIKIGLAQIAEDPEYIFGLPRKGNKKTTCADMIYKQLQDENLIPISNTQVPKIITPDYLFWLATQHPLNFEVVDFNL